MILLSRAYRGYLAGTIVQLLTSTEAALVAQGLATVSAGPVTAGAVTTDLMSGRVGFAAAAASVVVTNPNVTTESKIVANIAQAAADGTMTGLRVLPANGSFTIFANAAATAVVAVDWAIFTLSGELPPN